MLGIISFTTFGKQKELIHLANVTKNWNTNINFRVSVHIFATTNFIHRFFTENIWQKLVIIVRLLLQYLITCKGVYGRIEIKGKQKDSLISPTNDLGIKTTLFCKVVFLNITDTPVEAFSKTLD